MMKAGRIACVLLLAMVVATAAPLAVEPASWNHCQRGFDWGREYGRCWNGRAQSPIDLHPTKDKQDASLRPLLFDTGCLFLGGNPASTELAVTSNGDTAFVTPMIAKRGKPCQFVNPVGGDLYQLQQMHLHVNSEHAFDGVHRPLEIHLVFQRHAGGSQVATAVVSVSAEIAGQTPAEPERDEDAEGTAKKEGGRQGPLSKESMTSATKAPRTNAKNAASTANSSSNNKNGDSQAQGTDELPNSSSSDEEPTHSLQKKAAATHTTVAAREIDVKKNTNRPREEEVKEPSVAEDEDNNDASALLDHLFAINNEAAWTREHNALVHPGTMFSVPPLESNHSFPGVPITALLPTDGSYLTYTGSLTTPPCEEGVKWFVMQQPIQVNAAMWTRVKETLIDMSSCAASQKKEQRASKSNAALAGAVNARVLQPRLDRQVLRYVDEAHSTKPPGVAMPPVTTGEVSFFAMIILLAGALLFGFKYYRARTEEHHRRSAFTDHA